MCSKFVSPLFAFKCPLNYNAKVYLKYETCIKLDISCCLYAKDKDGGEEYDDGDNDNYYR